MSQPLLFLPAFPTFASPNFPGRKCSSASTAAPPTALLRSLHRTPCTRRRYHLQSGPAPHQSTPAALLPGWSDGTTVPYPANCWRDPLRRARTAAAPLSHLLVFARCCAAVPLSSPATAS